MCSVHHHGCRSRVHSRGADPGGREVDNRDSGKSRRTVHGGSPHPGHRASRRDQTPAPPAALRIARFNAASPSGSRTSARARTREATPAYARARTRRPRSRSVPRCRGAGPRSPTVAAFETASSRAGSPLRPAISTTSEPVATWSRSTHGESPGTRGRTPLHVANLVARSPVAHRPGVQPLCPHRSRRRHRRLPAPINRGELPAAREARGHQNSIVRG